MGVAPCSRQASLIHISMWIYQIVCWRGRECQCYKVSCLKSPCLLRLYFCMLMQELTGYVFKGGLPLYDLRADK